jgi:hypothetical protein
MLLQESALIPDAVSTSKAVGFWQFKDFTAIEMGLRVDREVDERMNIASSSRAAARYLKKNNTFFNNWLYNKTTQKLDFERVRGNFENNDFVREIVSHIQKKTVLGESMLEKLAGIETTLQKQLI